MGQANPANQAGNHWVSTLTAGLVSGLFLVFTAVSFAALLYSGPLSDWLSLAINQLLFGAAVAALIVAFLGGYGGTVAMPQGRIAPLIAVMVAGVVGGSGLEGETLFATALVAVVISTVGVGLFLFLLGGLGLGRLIRFMPYPVIGGFIAGTGWLLLLGAIRIMSGQEPTLDNAMELMHPDSLVLWLPGVVFGAVMLMADRLARSPFTFPLMIFFGIAAFYMGFSAAGLSPEALIERGMTLGPLPEGGPTGVSTFELLAGVDWATVFSNGGTLGTILVVSAVSLLLSCSGLELETRLELDLDKELRAAGIANVVAGVGGGIVSFHALGLTSVVRRMGSGGRMVAVIAASICILVLFLGNSLLEYLPLAIVGGLLAYLGFDFLYRWVVRGCTELSTPEYAIVLAILIVMATMDYLTGIAAGLVAAVLLFVITYSRVSVIKTALTGAELHSNVDRTPAETEALETVAGGIAIYRLHGFLFFGTVAGLLERIRLRVEAQADVSVSHVVLDFEQVSGMDSSAELSFRKLRQRAARSGFKVVLCGLHGLTTPITPESKDDAVCLEPDLDRAMERCESELLEKNGGFDTQRLDPVDAMQRMMGDEGMARQIIAISQTRCLQGDEYLFKQGDPARSLALIVSGRLNIILELGGRKVRLRTILPGNFVGEMGVYLQGDRSASVVAEGLAEVLELHDEALENLEREHPEVSTRLHRGMVRLLSERLGHANKAIRRLME